MNPPAFDPDAELQAQQESLAADYERGAVERRSHRCPPIMPPCPDCEAIYEAESEREDLTG